MEKKIKKYDLVINLTNKKITIYKKDCGIVLDESSVFAVNNDKSISGSNMLFGNQAINKCKNKNDIEKIQYINYGELYDVESAYSVVNEMLKKVEKDYAKKKFNAVFLVSSDISQEQYQKYVQLGKFLNFNSIKLVPKIVAYKMLKSDKPFESLILFDCDHIEFAEIENNKMVYSNNLAQDYKDLSDRIKFYLNTLKNNNTQKYEKINKNGFCVVGDNKDNEKYAKYISKDIKLPVSTVFATDNDAISCIGKLLDNKNLIDELSIKVEDLG